jgi:hypothetical protein
MSRCQDRVRASFLCFYYYIRLPLSGTGGRQLLRASMAHFKMRGLHEATGKIASEYLAGRLLLDPAGPQDVGRAYPQNRGKTG